MMRKMEENAKKLDEFIQETGITIENVDKTPFKNGTDSKKGLSPNIKHKINVFLPNK